MCGNKREVTVFTFFIKFVKISCWQGFNAKRVVFLEEPGHDGRFVSKQNRFEEEALRRLQPEEPESEALQQAQKWPAGSKVCLKVDCFKLWVACGGFKLIIVIMKPLFQMKPCCNDCLALVNNVFYDEGQIIWYF